MELYERLLETLGAEELLNQLVKAMSTEDLNDLLEYIARMNDLDIDEEDNPLGLSFEE